MEFDCWTGILVEGKPYTIVEKIRYKEKDSDDRWTEYGLVAEGEEKRLWLTVEGDNLSCTLSRTVHRSTGQGGADRHGRVGRHGRIRRGYGILPPISA